MTLKTLTSPKVFVSYSHDSKKHIQQVVSFANRLRSDGIDCYIDQYVTSPSEGWPSWCLDQVLDSDFVLVVCTDEYFKRFSRKTKRGEGKGANWEGFIISQELYENECNNTKFYPIIFFQENVEYIPHILRAYSHYLVDNEEGYDNLYYLLIDQPPVEMPLLGIKVSKNPSYIETISQSGLKMRSNDIHEALTLDSIEITPVLETVEYKDIQSIFGE